MPGDARSEVDLDTSLLEENMKFTEYVIHDLVELVPWKCKIHGTI